MIANMENAKNIKNGLIKITQSLQNAPALEKDYILYRFIYKPNYCFCFLLLNIYIIFIIILI